jgi:hypothetical protein
MITFDMNDSRVVYDSPNIRFVDGRGVMLVTGDELYTHLAPGTPGYQAPPAPAPKKKRPFHRKPITQSNSDPSIPMPILKYNVVPKSNGGFPTRVLLADEFEDSEVDNIVATRTGLSEAQCVAVITAYHETFRRMRRRLRMDARLSRPLQREAHQRWQRRHAR